MSWLQRLFKKSYDGRKVTTSATIIGTGGANFSGSITMNGVSFFASDGTPEAAVTGLRKGDQCNDYTNGKVYIFAGTPGANTGWKLVTQAA